MTSGGALTAAPLPANSNQFRFNSEPVAVGWRNTKKRRCVPAGGVAGRSTLTSCHVCQPPVGAMFGVGDDERAVRRVQRSSMVPPAPAGGDAEA